MDALNERLLFLFLYLDINPIDITRQISSDTAGAHHIPSPPAAAMQMANAADMVISHLPNVIARAAFGHSIAVKNPPIIILKPIIRKETLKIRNTEAEYTRSSAMSSDIKADTSPSAPAQEPVKAAAAIATMVTTE